MALLKIFAASSSIVGNCSTNQYAGREGRQFLAIIETVVPSVAFVILLRYYLRGTAIPVDKILLAGYAGIALVAGISSGWLGSFVGVAIMAAAVYVYERRKLPLVAIMIGVPIILFLARQREISSALLASRCFGELCRAIQFLDG